MKMPEKIQLANLPTPIVKLERLSRELQKEIYVWRDDCTGFLESGNKIRKLEFVLAEALHQGATHLVTCGGPQSNHARSTVILARRLGLEVTVVMREPRDPSLYGADTNGNLLLDQIFGADLQKVSYAEYAKRGAVYDSFLREAADEIRARGGNPYVIPEGASSPLGCFGYIAGTEELLLQWRKQTGIHSGPDSLFCALGSGGTYAGLVLGFDLHGLGSERVWAVNICDDKTYFEKRVTGILQGAAEKYDIPLSGKPLQILDGHVGLGYAQATEAELKDYMAFARTDGLLLDPVYTGKAFRGMIREIRLEPKRFGSHVVFLHSGGLFATFAYASRFMSVARAGAST